MDELIAAVKSTILVDKNHIKKSKLEKKYKVFNSVRTSFPSVKKLSDKERELLYILECRSEPNNGDTKINNDILCKLLDRSRQQIDRYLKKLEQLGFVARLSIAYKSLKNGKFYRDRTIRCRRIFLKSRFSFKRNLNWKIDNRPDFDSTTAFDESTGSSLSIKWLVGAREILEFSNGKTVKSPWTWLGDLFNMGLLCAKQQDMYIDLKEKKEIDYKHPVASKILGMKFSFNGG